MDLRWIEAFLAVVDHGSFSAASTYLYRSQSRISSYVAALETDLGVALFDRKQRPARLTAEGAAFIAHARQAADTIEMGKAAALAVHGLARGDVSLAIYASAGAEFVPELLHRFGESYPNIEVQLVEHPARGIDQALDSGETQIAIRPTSPPLLHRHNFSSELLWRERMCLVVPNDHPLASCQAPSPADLVDQPMVVAGPSLRDTEVARQLASAGIKPTIRYVSDQPQTLVALVRRGLAVGLTNTLALRSLRLEGVTVTLMPPSLRRDVGVYWSPALTVSTAASALLETIRSTPAPPETIDLRTSRDPKSG